jgi:hypothetical protein
MDYKLFCLGSGSKGNLLALFCCWKEIFAIIVELDQNYIFTLELLWSRPGLGSIWPFSGAYLHTHIWMDSIGCRSRKKQLVFRYCLASREENFQTFFKLWTALRDGAWNEQATQRLVFLCSKGPVSGCWSAGSSCSAGSICSACSPSSTGSGTESNTFFVT